MYYLLLYGANRCTGSRLLAKDADVAVAAAVDTHSPGARCLPRAPGGLSRFVFCIFRRGFSAISLSLIIRISLPLASFAISLSSSPITALAFTRRRRTHVNGTTCRLPNPNQRPPPPWTVRTPSRLARPSHPFARPGRRPRAIARCSGPN